MRKKTAGALVLSAWCGFISVAGAQDLGPQVKKLADGVYVHMGRGFESNSGIILTQDGVVVIDTGQNPYESRNLWATVRNLTSMPVRSSSTPSRMLITRPVTSCSRRPRSSSPRKVRASRCAPPD